jgi:hypothetical protein
VKPKRGKPKRPKPSEVRRPSKVERAAGVEYRKEVKAEARDMREAMTVSLESLSRRVREAFPGLGTHLATAINKDGSVDAELRIDKLGDKDGKRAYEIMKKVDTSGMLYPPTGSWVTIGTALSGWTSAKFDEEQDELEEDMSAEDAIEEIRSRYARFQGLDFVANYPQLARKIHESSVTAREILQRAIASRGGNVHQIVFRLGWKRDFSRPDWMRTAPTEGKVPV